MNREIIGGKMKKRYRAGGGGSIGSAYNSAVTFSWVAKRTETEVCRG